MSQDYLGALPRRAHALTWCRVSVGALRANARTLRSRLGEGAGLGAVVKSDAYGHGLELTTLALADEVDRFVVHTAEEALRVRALAPKHPILVVGPVPREAFGELAAAGVAVTIADVGHLISAPALPSRLAIHLKIETGTNRQGISAAHARDAAMALKARHDVGVVGVSTHFADVEDTLDHAFARGQWSAFAAAAESIEAEVGRPLERHCANSAATLLWPHTHGAFVRAGIAMYGLWPSRETWLSVLESSPDAPPELSPALSWHARVTELKTVPAGEYIGYGRTFRATSPTRIAVLGVGYADGYDRGLSNAGWVLADGVRAPIRGRVCMNLTMVDVTDVPGARVGGEAILLGPSADERITAELMASWCGTINYEIPTRIALDLPRVAVDVPDELAGPFESAGVPVETLP